MRGDFAAHSINLTLCLVLMIGTVLSRPVELNDDINTQGKAINGIVETSKTNINPSNISTGKLRRDNVAFQMSSISNLWVDVALGDDGNNGLTRATAFRSIQKAADVAISGTTVHILPGIYREAVRPTLSGSATKPIVYRAENGPGTVIIRGSEGSNSLLWNQLETNTIGLPPSVNPGNLYYADLSAWALNDSPRFVVQLGSSGVIRLPLAREPDWQVAAEWKYAEFWWAADGGSIIATCNPASSQDPDCDISSRSTTRLTDRQSDNEPPGIELGNLTTFGDLTGATLVAMDTDEGHYVYRRKIIAHDSAAGRITVDRPCEFDSGSGQPGLGWGSKYYIENHPALLETPGEWWYDANTTRLYLWPPISVNPATLSIEISHRYTGFDLTNLSNITLDGLTLEFFNGSAIKQNNNDNNKSFNNIVRNATLRFANIGIDLGQGADGLASNITDGFTLEYSKVSQMDSRAILLNYWWPGGSADSFTHAGIVNTVSRNNELYDLGFRSDGDNAMGVLFNHADKLRFEGNYVHHVAQNGVAFSRSIVQSPKERGFSPEEIKTGEILIKNNVFEKACLLDADCGELKIQGNAPDNHVFRDLLITGNVFRNTFGWTYVSEKRRRWSGGTNSDVQGMGGFGLYVDNASGINAYRNIAYNNASSGFHLYNYWWDGDIVLYNNTIANSLHGIRLDGDTRSSINTKIVNNILVTNEGYGILLYRTQGDYGNFLLDYNLYYNNGWRVYKDGGMWQPGEMALYRPNDYYQTLADIQTNTLWDEHSVEGNPEFWDYDTTDHDLFDKSWPDFHLTSASVNALDRGTTALQASLNTLLAFEMVDLRRGQAYDIGRYEGGFNLLASPTVRFLCEGGVARYTLRLNPSDIPYSVALSVTSPLPSLDISLSSPTLSTDKAVTLTITDGNMDSKILPTLAYTIPISATGGGFAKATSVRIFIGGFRICAHHPVK